MRQIDTRLVIGGENIERNYIESLRLTQESSSLCDAIIYDFFEFVLINPPFVPKKGDTVKLYRDNVLVLTQKITNVKRNGIRYFCEACDNTFFLQFIDFFDPTHSALDGFFYQTTDISNILNDILNNWDADWESDHTEITGFVKFNNARKALNDILFSAGFVKETDSDGKIFFKSLDSNLNEPAHFFEHENIFINPSINYSPSIKSVSLSSYTYFSPGDVEPTGNYVEYPEGVYHPYSKNTEIFESDDISRNGSAIVADVLTITPVNAPNIYQRILRQYATGNSVEFEVSEQFRNNKYLNKFCVVDLKDEKIKGICTKVVTTFGKTLDKQRLVVIGFEKVAENDLVNVTINYYAQDIAWIFEQKEMSVPVSTIITIAAPNIYLHEEMYKGVWILDEQEEIRELLVTENVSITINYSTAALLEDGILKIFAVDDAEQDNDILKISNALLTSEDNSNIEDEVV